MKPIIAYYRVSTRKQERSGLGLEAQQAEVEDFARKEGDQIIHSYTEVEKGRRKDRPQLAKAIGHANLAKATLVVAKLDRLARNVAFTSALLESGVDFVACDNPHANKFTIHILAAVAEQEAEAISQRTKAALQAAKRRGIKLGSSRPGHWKGREDKRQAGMMAAVKAAAVTRSRQARKAYSFLEPLIGELKQQGATFQQIADRLNSDSHTTRTGKPWTPMTAWRVWKRACSA